MPARQKVVSKLTAARIWAVAVPIRASILAIFIWTDDNPARFITRERLGSLAT
jgi:hypothetical protein